MYVKSGGGKASFDILASDSSGDESSLSNPVTPREFHDLTLTNGAVVRDANFNGSVGRPGRRKRKHKKKRPESNGHCEDEFGLGFIAKRSIIETVVCENSVMDQDFDSLRSLASSCVSYVELRQRNVSNGGSFDVHAEGNNGMRESSGSNSSLESAASTSGTWMPEESTNGTGPKPGQWSPEETMNGGVTRLETMESLDWNKVMSQDPNLLAEISSIERSPLKYFMRELYGGNPLRSAVSVGNEKKRQRVYNTMFHVPLRCERLIVAGFFFCLDSFLSLLTIMPARIVMTIWRVLKTRQFRRPSAAELSDIGCFVVLAFGVVTLQLTDISLIYHIIRGQGTLKLYVVYNVLELFDKLCQSFGEDVLQVLFNSAEGLANCSADKLTFELLRFIFDGAIAVIAFIVHSFILLAQAITLSTCIIAHNNALMALLISNNFAEVKSNVFKRFSKGNLQNMVYYDIVERFHITAFVLFVLAQNILEAEGPWFESFLMNALLVYVCEMFIDTIKHSFLAKFNEIKPVAYSDFLEDLCKQTLNEKPEERKQDLTFIPLAPACVVIRVLTPIYSNLLPFGPLPWRLFWILIWSSLTYIMLTIARSWLVSASAGLRLGTLPIDRQISNTLIENKFFLLSP